MKKIVGLPVLIVMFCLSYKVLLAQDLAVYKVIGKTQNDAITLYGNPVHKDVSNSSMACLFYKSKYGDMVLYRMKRKFSRLRQEKFLSTKKMLRMNLIT